MRLSFLHQVPMWRWLMSAVAAAVLLVPAIAMRITPEVRWGWEDFASAAVLLGGAWLALEVALRFATQRATRLAGSAAIMLVFLAAWGLLAVGFD
ncbi:hypothetical protein [Rhizobium halophilum]|uniref:hypothetical protein n=1 Tax=Rhizobium halophilum TaxID=2846852 RepID=UPI001EFE23B0|nr:hypothetical protein [Rhizobium halophilum]MCF6370062.1 hypothetical protein [Rhizobium halophilum]